MTSLSFPSLPPSSKLPHQYYLTPTNLILPILCLNFWSPLKSSLIILRHIRLISCYPGHLLKLSRTLTNNDDWTMLEQLLVHRAPHIGGRAGYLQKKIYDLNVIPIEDLASFINRSDVLQKNILLSNQTLSPDILFEQVVTHLKSCQGFPSFIGTKFFAFFLFQ